MIARCEFVKCITLGKHGLPPNRTDEESIRMHLVGEISEISAGLPRKQDTRILQKPISSRDAECHRAEMRAIQSLRT